MKKDEMMMSPTPWTAHDGDDEIDLRELLAALWRGKYWILASAILGAGLAVAVALLLPNIYHAEATLAPSEEQQGGGLSSLAGQFGGLASLAGVNLGGTGRTDKTGLAVAVAQSRHFLTGFVRRHRLEVAIMAATGMDKGTGELTIDPELYDVTQKKWVREAKPGRSVEPSDWELFRVFSKLISVEQDKKTGLVTIGVDYFSPELAKQWVDWLVADLNAVMKQRDLTDTQRNIAYLKDQLAKTSVADMQTVFYKLIEEQTKTLMLAEVNPDYVFKTLDPAVVPEEKAKPKRALIAVLGTLLGGMLGVMLVLVRHALRRNGQDNAGLTVS
ncbi:Wzz/FepE/Etk N-terminal domain-containing protein [Pseudaeromonas sp. ZJS20]|uniref:Wzz/FepE/Etk N-terminal domain-containing protein n=1 Tax=Pseudaeromonas aegiceratis TaxID=3153928 RepID=UPI00390C9D7B